jgi:rhodanese-related sulfurtransferase
VKSFDLRQWGLRLAILMAIPGAVALADALVVRPVTPVPPAPRATASDGTKMPSQNAITLTDLQAFYDSGAGFFLDARPIAQFRAGHIPGAFHVDVDAFRQGRPPALDFLPTDTSIVIYCGGGDCDASHMVERMMRSHGYTELLIFEEGFPSWVAAGLPVEEGDPPI